MVIYKKYLFWANGNTYNSVIKNENINLIFIIFILETGLVKLFIKSFLSLYCCNRR